MEENDLSKEFILKGDALKRRIGEMKKVPWWHKILPNIFQGTSWFLGMLLFIIFTDIKIIGKKNLKKALLLKNKQKSGVIFVLNHVSELDPMLSVSGIFPWTSLFPMFYVSLPMEFYKKAKHFGWRRYVYGPTLFYLWGAHPVIWKAKNYEISLTRHIQLLNKGVSLCIFPQGRMGKQGTGIDEVKGGAGYLAYKTASVVVPTALVGVQGISIREFFSRKRKIKVIYGEPIPYSKVLDTAKKCENQDNKYKCITNYFAKKVKKLMKEYA